MQDFLLNKMKIGRPTLKKAVKKGQIIGVRFTPDERRLVEKAASKSGKTISQWMRNAALEMANVRANTAAAVSG